MPTDVIDTALHLPAFPTAYAGPGTLIGNPVQANNGRVLSCFFTSDGNPVVVPLGFLPVYIKIVNDTDGIAWEWIRGLAATHSTKLTGAADLAVDTTGAVVVSGDTLDGNMLVTLSAALCGTAKNIVVLVFG